MLGHGLDNPIARADIVKQEITVGMKLFVRHGGRKGESAAVELRARSSGGQRLDVTLVAAHFCEQLPALLGHRGRSKLGVARRSFAGTDEPSEMIDVGEPVRARPVIGFRDGVTKIGDFIGLEAAGHPHFVEVGVRGKGEQAGLLVFPAKAPDGGLAGRFDDRNVEGLPQILWWLLSHCSFARSTKVWSGTASTKPSPKRLRETRKVRMFAESGTRC